MARQNVQPDLRPSAARWPALLVLGGTLALAFTGALIHRVRAWNEGTREIRTRLESSRVTVAPTRVDFAELAGLPEPVQRYLRSALVEGQPMVSGAELRQVGSIDMGTTTARWKPFVSDQRVVTRRPGFDWHARITLLPGVKVWVHDAYAGGIGILRAAVSRLFVLAETRGAGEIAEGELMRFFAEAVWYPTALLPSQGVRWEPVDERSARGTITDGTTTVTLLFSFDDQGLVNEVLSHGRGRIVGDTAVPTPWQGRHGDYQVRGGMRLPLEGEVAWLLPAGRKPYWRGRITTIQHTFQAPRSPPSPGERS